jgi:arylsulfatase A-like enzyme
VQLYLKGIFMKRKSFLKKVTLSVVGFSAFNELFTAKKKKNTLFGTSLDPDILQGEKGFTTSLPKGKFSPEGAWSQTWRVWLPTRGRKQAAGYGYLKIYRRPGKAGVAYNVEQSLLSDNKWLVMTTSGIKAKNDIFSSPVSWEINTDVLQIKKGSSEAVRISGSKVKKALADVSNEQDQIASGFLVPDIVQRMAVKKISELTFTVLDEMDKVKKNNTVTLIEKTTIPFGGKSVKVYYYEQIGEGALPWKYYVDMEGRLLMAINGMRVLFLDDDADSQYKIIKKYRDGAYTKKQSSVRKNKKSNKPNVLFITTDQQSWDTISACGNKDVNTPHLDRLAKRGVSFKKSYSPNPVCSPTRATWLTGLASCEHGVITNGKKIVEDIKTVGHAMSDAGYETVFAGKLHVGIPSSYREKIPGFEKVFPEGVGGAGTIGDQSVSHSIANYITERDDARPFFMSVNFLQPHDICNWISRNSKNKGTFPYRSVKNRKLPDIRPNTRVIHDVPKKMKVPVKMDWTNDDWQYYLFNYYRMVEEVDAEIGRVLNALKDSGQEENTVIIFNADHGEGMGEHSSVTKNNLYDAAVRVPFIVAYPKELKQGIIDSTYLVSGLDVVPTVCDFAGAKVPDNCKGKSVRGIASGKDEKGNEFIVSEVNNDEGRMIRTADYKLIAFRDDTTHLLFDMKNDPWEKKNLAGDKKYASVLKEHINKLESWERGLERAPVADKGVFTVAV